MSESELIAGISGVRGIVGESLGPPEAMAFGAAMGSWLAERRGGPPHAVVARDGRRSGAALADAAAAGLMSVGARVTRLDPVATPGAAIVARRLRADGGVMVTASHNPVAWNGLKPLLGEARPPMPEEAEDLLARFRAAAPRGVGSPSYGTESDWPGAPHAHAEAVARLVDARAIRDRGFRVALDSVHGAGGAGAYALLSELGVRVVEHLGAEPTGAFPHAPEPLPANLGELCAATGRAGADLGLAQDPDADRLALVDESGRCLSEECTFALAAQRVLERAGPGATVVANLATSRMIDEIARSAGARLVRSPVGEANVVAAMRAAGAAVGGEGNGGVILPAASHVRDALVAMGLILELLATRNRPLSALAAALPDAEMIKEKRPLGDVPVAAVAEALERAFPDAAVDRRDGLRFDFSDRWVLVRPSNTEPVLRVIAEAPTAAGARELIEAVGKHVPAA